ncbi:hypothetical protein AC32_3719 [Escherichia coli 3-105-05_S3_C2]|nr:hypothetical protein ECDEC13C_1859 [Escherichia coli DEC13C]EHX67736.1 hypothetical protein ECDEC13D_0919 [Escherichia coli DEC13D]EIO75565.1 hypothetical protein ECTW09109_2428 [Escherichia coli TW09109]ESA25248.1 hypothetical protein L912_3657 [Escherichia coli SCD1]EYE24595.1 hypothetical protein AB69_1655 [Escherichia coli 1-110-08_S1_C3]EYE37381.1 hypothetical protein AB10_1835 [Escherichia coli 1-110-08_S1_C1]KDT34606.1 hypothetical protein AC04_3930 [Escherichia coli 3-105-05_S3_C1]
MRMPVSNQAQSLPVCVLDFSAAAIVVQFEPRSASAVRRMWR